MNREILHSLNLIAKELATINRDTERDWYAIPKHQKLDFAKGLIEVEEADDDDDDEKRHTINRDT